MVEEGASVRTGRFALARILDPAALWRAVVGEGTAGSPVLAGSAEAPRLRTGRGVLELTHGEALALLFGPRVPLRVAAALAPAERTALAGRLPAPLYLWGFDSI